MIVPHPVDSRSTLVDGFGRRHTDFRISVTDRCNIRCFYCMPAEVIRFKPREELLSFEEIERLVRVAAGLGITKLRLTGGEPLVRHGLPTLVRMLKNVPGIDDIALTTNGILLAEQAQPLKDAGLDRLNISLDTLDADRFQQITRRTGLDKVLEGIFAAQRAGFERIKLNAVAIAGLIEQDVIPLGHFARAHGLELRFIEYMPLDADQHWERRQVVSGEDLLRTLAENICPLQAIEPAHPGQPAVDYRFTDGRGRVGFINPVSQPFCETCNRLRVTAEGQLRNCLFSIEEWDARALLRGGAGDDELTELVRDCVAHKRAGHGIDSSAFARPERAMYQIGG